MAKIFNIDLKDIILYGGALGFVACILIFLISITIIGHDVKKQCEIAQDKYSGDCVESLIAYLQDDDNTFRSRNSAIWALGEFGDERALPVLQSYYTGDIPSREALSAGISQYELKKAIRLVEGGFNATAFFWRFGSGID